ncbi:MAG: polysaccharide pyruvyl transferase family protein [Clostridiales bacterium]|nr:polysaccharide pyruvyl transferase family protein [Clostridiales bacterium]
MKCTYLAICYFHGNYGSVLQAFATQEYLKKIGVPNRTIRIDGLKKHIKIRKVKYFLTQILNKDVVSDKYSYLRLWFMRKTDAALNRDVSTRKSIFKEFVEQNFDLTEPFASFAELGRACEQNCRCVLVGSDQLWLPANIEAGYYTLSFAPDTVKKVSYATSFGVSEIPAGQARKAAGFLRKFEVVSVRELSGQKIVDGLTGVVPPVVCDPVLLFTADEWARYCPTERKYKNKYILCYLLGPEKKYYEWVKTLRDTTGCKVVALLKLDAYMPESSIAADYKPFDIDPFGFVDLIRNAEYICTDSYHATLFSLLFHKKVFVFKRFPKESTMSTNARLESLFTLLGMDGGGGGDAFTAYQTPLSRSLNVTYDYEAIDAALAGFRKKSASFLRRAL